MHTFNQRKCFGHEELKNWYRQVDIAEDYMDRRFSSPYGQLLHQKQMSFIHKMMVKYKPKRIMDLACGPARSLSVIASVPKWILYDASKKMLDLAAKRINQGNYISNGYLIQGDGFNLPFKQSLDMILSLRFLRHFRYQQRKELYEKIKNTLAPGGIFIFDAVNFDMSYSVRKIDNALDIDIYDKLYHLWELEEEIKESGFKIIDLQGIYYQYLQARFFDKIFRKIKMNWLGFAFLSCLENRKKGQPLEWMVACQK